MLHQLTCHWTLLPTAVDVAALLKLKHSSCCRENREDGCLQRGRGAENLEFGTWTFPPLIIHFNNGNFHYKPTNFGIPHLWNPPYNINLRLATEPKRESSLSSTRRSGIRKSRQRVYACVLCTSRKSIAACALRMLPVDFLRLIQYLGS